MGTPGWHWTAREEVAIDTPLAGSRSLQSLHFHFFQYTAGIGKELPSGESPHQEHSTICNAAHAAAASTSHELRAPRSNKSAATIKNKERDRRQLITTTESRSLSIKPTSGALSNRGTIPCSASCWSLSFPNLPSSAQLLPSENKSLSLDHGPALCDHCHGGGTCGPKRCVRSECCRPVQCYDGRCALFAGVALPHWVGPIKGKPIDKACYRKSYITTTKQCSPGYNFDKVLTCWTQCPIEYPVECGMECIPQNMDCTKAILDKVASVATVALNAASSGVFGQLATATKGVQTGVKCGQQLFAVVTKVVGFIDEIENGGNVDTTKDQLLFLLSKSDFVVYDLPVAVATCLGKPVPNGLDQAKEIVDVVKTVVDMIVNKKLSGVNLLDFGTFLNATSTEVPAVSKSVSSLSPSDQDYLQKLVGSGMACGTDILAIVNKIIATVQQLKTSNPKSPVDVIRFAVLSSNLVLKELPDAAASCVNTATGFSSRDQILKSVHVIIDKIVSSSSQNGKPVSSADYAISIANMGLDAIALFDPTGIAAMAAEFIQPICGPTAYIGEIDDGPADLALALTSAEKAFRNSTGTWTKAGDGQLQLTFTSVDDEDVRVNVFSGGKKLYEVPVKKGGTVAWSKPLAEFQGKTLYLDRWRPGFLDIPGTGGGSILTWVPNQSNGALALQVKINPTSFSDHKLLRH